MEDRLCADDGTDYDHEKTQAVMMSFQKEGFYEYRYYKTNGNGAV